MFETGFSTVGRVVRRLRLGSLLKLNMVIPTGPPKSSGAGSTFLADCGLGFMSPRSRRFSLFGLMTLPPEMIVTGLAGGSANAH